MKNLAAFLANHSGSLLYCCYFMLFHMIVMLWAGLRGHFGLLLQPKANTPKKFLARKESARINTTIACPPAARKPLLGWPFRSHHALVFGICYFAHSGPDSHGHACYRLFHVHQCCQCKTDKGNFAWDCCRVAMPTERALKTERHMKNQHEHPDAMARRWQGNGSAAKCETTLRDEMSSVRITRTDKVVATGSKCCCQQAWKDQAGCERTHLAQKDLKRLPSAAHMFAVESDQGCHAEKAKTGPRHILLVQRAFPNPSAAGPE